MLDVEKLTVSELEAALTVFTPLFSRGLIIRLSDGALSIT
jgi:hypothetical protein